MVKVSTDDVNHLATLSALKLKPDEVEAMRQDIESILGFVEQLSQLDTAGVEPTYQVTGLESVSRPDLVELSEVSTDQLLDLSHGRDGQFIKVPKVL